MVAKFRFGVGTTAALPCSSIWFITTTRNDVYIGVRVLGGSLKASLHWSRQCHVRYGDAAYLGSMANRRAFSWARQETPDSGVHQAVAILFPTDLLRGKIALQPGRPPDAIFTPAPSGSAVEVGVFFSREHAAGLEARFSRHGLPLMWAELGNGEFVSIALRVAPFDRRGLGPLNDLVEKGSVQLPKPVWQKDAFEADPEKSMSGVLFNDPAKDGALVMTQVTGLRLHPS